MTKNYSSLFLIILVLYGCTNQERSVDETKDSKDRQTDEVQNDPVFYADIDNEKQHNFELIQIENDQYRLSIDKYCLNDSLLPQKVFIDDESKGKLKPAINVYHNYEVMLHLGNLDSDPHTVFLKKINKELFKDSLPEEFYDQATVFNVFYHGVRSNRIYFDVILSVPDSDWQEEFRCGIFFRTRKISQLDYWKT